MNNPARFVTGLALASMLFAAPVAAQDSGSMQVGNATVTVGAGAARLDLPDVPSLLLLGPNKVNVPLSRTFKSSDDFGDEFGWNINGSIEVPTGATRTVSLNGFWANIEDDDSTAHPAVPGQLYSFTALIDDPAVQQIAGAVNVPATTRGKREVDHWGVSLESKWIRNPSVMGVTRALPRGYFALGADIRGIDQDISEEISILNGLFTGAYDEDLDTRYYGAYVAWGRDYTIPFLSGLTQGLGLQSSFLLRGGVYYADTDYEGRLVKTGPIEDPSGSLSLSDDDVAFIGGLVLETRKKIGRRAMLSLKGEYEYYSYVPEMAYNQRDQVGTSIFYPNGQAGTRIGSDDAFSARTSLRLTIKLGPVSVFEEPMK